MVGRTAIALLSVIVLSYTGLAWASLNRFGGGEGAVDLAERPYAEDGAVDLLLIGNDSRNDKEGNPLPESVLRELRTTYESGDLTDTMILVRIPNGGQRASAVSFPRDTLVDMGEFGKHKLTEAFSRAKNAEAEKLQEQGLSDPKEIEKKAREAGRNFLISTIEDISGAGIDHYAEVNLLGFYEVTKAIGGVEVCLKEPVDDSEWSGAVFPAGPQTIQGADALAFVRQRHGLTNELDRVTRQKVFMSALVGKVLSAGTLANPARLTDLVGAVERSVVLDDKLANDILGFASQLQGIAGGDVEFHTAPVHFVGESGEEDVTIQVPEVRQFVANLLLPPAERARKEQQQAQQAAAREDTTVSVFNASGETGLAGRVLEEVGAAGFTTGGSANADSRASSLIYHAPGDQAAAQQLAEMLGGVEIAESQNLSAGNLEVYLGDDYAGPGADFAGQQSVRLDGLRQAPVQAQAPDTADEPPITANGVPCVN
ncbi:LCP family protein [Saccharopolyspora cebuensis]